MFAHKIHALALAAETGIFEGQQRGDGVAVVDLRGVHVPGFKPGHVERPLRRRADRGMDHVLGVGRRLECQVFTEPGDKRGSLASPGRDFFGRNNHRGATGHRHDDLQHVQRIGNLFARQHLLDGQRLAIKHRLRVVLRIGALVHRDLGQRPRVVPVLRAIALGDHGVTGVLTHVAIGQIELCFGRTKCRAVAAKAHGPGHPAWVFVRPHGRHARWQHAQHRLTQPQLNGRGGAPDHAHRGAAAQVDHFSEVQFEPQVFGRHGGHEHRRLMKLRAVDHQPVEVTGL